MEIEIRNRIPLGVSIGWTFFGRDNDFGYDELTLHLVLIDIVIRWI